MDLNKVNLVTLLCYLLGLFLAVALIYWPFYESFSMRYDSKCEKCCKLLDNSKDRDTCNKRCIIGGDVCPCCEDVPLAKKNNNL